MFCVRKNCGQENFHFQKRFWVKLWFQKILGLKKCFFPTRKLGPKRPKSKTVWFPKDIWSKNILVQKDFGYKLILGTKSFWVKKVVWYKKILGQKDLGEKKILGPKLRG